MQAEIKARTGYAIDTQNDADLQALMKRVYVNMAVDPFTDVRGQIDRMNAAYERALELLRTGTTPDPGNELHAAVERCR